MSDPKFTWRTEDDSAIVASLSFAPENGVQTAEQVVRLWNDRNGSESSDTATELVITCKTRAKSPAGQEFGFTHAAAAYGWVLVRATGSGGDGSPAAHLTSLFAIGLNRELRLRDLPSNSYRKLAISVLVPAGVGSQSFDVLLIARSREVSESLPDGMIDSGLRSLYGEPGAAYIASGGEISTSGSASVEIAPSSWLFDGVPYSSIEQQVTLTQSDGASVALAAGEEWIGVITLEDGAAVLTKGLKAAAGNASAPAAGANKIAEVRVSYEVGGTSVIEDADVSQAMMMRGGFALEYDASSTTLIVHPGEAQFSQRLVRTTGKRFLVFPLSSSKAAWITPGGAFVVGEESAPPVAGSFRLALVETDGVGIISAVGCADLVDKATRLSASLAGSLSVGATTTPILYSGKSIGRIAFGGFSFSVGTLGGTSGSTKVDAEILEPGGSWVSLFPNSGTTDLRPSLPYGSTPHGTRATPETVSIAPGSLVRFKVIEVPGTASQDLCGELLLVQSR
jgi:hypothetical protein